MAAKRYLKIFFALWVALIVAIAGFNWWIDPYDMFPSPQSHGVNQEKPEATTRQRLSKAYGVSRARPEVLILGSSRGLAIAAHHEVWANKRVYNLALASTSLKELYRHLQHANAEGTVREFILGLDWITYNDGIGNSSYADARLRVDSSGAARPFNAAQYMRDIMPSLWSIDAVGASVDTIRNQPSPGETNAAWSARRDRERLSRKGGNRSLFLEFEKNTIYEASSQPFATSRNRGQDGPGTQTMREILRYAYTHGITARLFISPEHAHLLEIWRATGRWQEIEFWSRELVRIIAEEAKIADKPPFQLWDFSGYNTVTTERIPLPGHTEAPMRWYWEASHYTEALGYVMIDRMYNYQTPLRPTIDDFGVLIATENIDDHLLELHAARDVYAAQFSDDVQAIQSIVDAANRFYHR
ncbi:MAG: hypothetical protein OEW08_07600 [Gammaproteobacteria bacterium]|nr:hypothetical protein [Gammaproteobacteria bacterium]